MSASVSGQRWSLRLILRGLLCILLLFVIVILIKIPYITPYIDIDDAVVIYMISIPLLLILLLWEAFSLNNAAKQFSQITQNQAGLPVVPIGPFRKFLLVITIGIFAIALVCSIVLNVFEPAFSILANVFQVVSVLISVIVFIIGESWLHSALDAADDWARQQQNLGTQALSIAKTRIRGESIFQLACIQWMCILLMFFTIMDITSSNVAQIFRDTVVCRDGICPIMIDGQRVGLNDGHTEGLQALKFLSDPHLVIPEQLIYAQNQAIKSNDKYVTVVVVTPLSGGSRATQEGSHILQGIYVLQKKVNAQNQCTLASCTKIHIVIANPGEDFVDQSTVVHQILQLKRSDTHFLGVVGWPESTADAIEGIQDLTQANVLVISSSASSDALTGISSLFFRIAPPDSEQGIVQARYATNDLLVGKDLPSKNIVVFYSPNLPYSKTLAANFVKNVSSGSTVYLEQYTWNKDQDTRNISINDALQNVAKLKPEVIVFEGYSDDFSSLQNDLADRILSFSPLVLAGDAAYELGGYTDAGYKNFYFTGFASADEWGKIDCGSNKPFSYGMVFLCAYGNDFSQYANGSRNPNGFSKPDSATMLAFDAITVLIAGYEENMEMGNKTPTTNDVQKVLLQGDTSCHGFQGVSGSIIFGPDGNPINKPMVELKVTDSQTSTGYTVFVGLAVATSTASPNITPSGFQPCSPVHLA